MTDPEGGTDRAARRTRRFLSPLQKYEIFLQMVRQEATMAEAAEKWGVDRGVILRIRTVAKEGRMSQVPWISGSPDSSVGRDIEQPCGYPQRAARCRVGDDVSVRRGALPFDPTPETEESYELARSLLKESFAAW